MTLSPLRKNLFWLAAVVVTVVVVYAPGLGNSLVFDDGYLADGQLFADYGSGLPLKPRLLSYGSFVWLQALFGEGWWKQRLLNVVLHLGVVVALWRLYREILGSLASPEAEGPETAASSYADSPALPFAIGFFALNPVAVYAVGYLIQRSIVMATLFVVLGLWAFVLGVRRRRAWYFAAALASYALAILSKEHAILAPLAAMPLYIVVARPSPRRIAAALGSGALLVTVAAALLYSRYGEILGKPFDEYSRIYLAQLARLQPGADQQAFALSIVNQCYLFVHYGLRWLLPFSEWMSINLRPPFPTTLLAWPQAIGVLAYATALIGGMWMVIRYRGWPELVGLSLSMAALLFATEFATVWVQDPFVLYRSYLWAIGIPGIVFFVVHGPSTRVVASVAIAAAVFLMWQSMDRVMSLSTPEAAWTDAIAKLPRDPRSVGRWFPYLNRGAAYVDGGQYSLAMKDFQASAALGDMGMGDFNAGALLAASGRHAEALAAFDRAQKQGYDLYNLPFQRGLSLMALARGQEAWHQFEIAWQLQPPSPTLELLLLNFGRLGMQIGKPAEAATALQRLLQREPENAEARRLLPMALIMKGDAAAAKQILDREIDAKPSGASYYARALANYSLKHKPEALADIDQAIRLAPQNANLLQWRAKIQAMP